MLEPGICLLLLNSTYDHGIVFENGWHIKIHGDVCKRGLKTNTGRNIYIKNKFLHSLLNLFICQVIMAYKWSKKCVKIGNGLGTCCFALQRIEKIDNLSQSRSEMLWWRAFNFALNTLKAAFK